MNYQMVVESSRENNRINALHLADFLYKFRAAYVVALSFVEYEFRLNINSFEEDEYALNINPFNINNELKNSFHRFISSNRSMASMAVLSKENLPYEIDLNFLEISTNSPLKFIGYCTGASMLALSLAVALAGGTADLEKKVFVVKPLLEATATIIKELRR